MEIYTIGFTQKTAGEFFDALAEHRIERLVDVRLNNASQLAGFTKATDLPFFLERLLGATYEHEPLLAPTSELLSGYRKKRITWDQYEPEFLQLMAERSVESRLDRSDFEQRTVLLCSEATADRCHRRLVVEYLTQHWPNVSARHL